MTFRGRIFKIPFPFTDLSGQKARPALAITEPDEYGDIEFLFITSKQARDFGRTLELTADAFVGQALPFPSLLHLDKRYLLAQDIILKELAEVTDSFLEKVLRGQTLQSAKRHYEVRHEKKVAFRHGDRIPYAGRVFYAQ